jgi:hypothetical protein
MIQEWYFINPELVLAKLGVQLVLSYSLKHDSKVFIIFFEYTRMSPMKTTTKLSNSSMKIEFMRYMKCAGVFVNPNDMTRYSYMPYLMEKDILGISLARILI